MIAAVTLATALGGAIASICTAWAGGIVTRGELDQEMSKRKPEIDALAARSVVLEAAVADHTKRLQPLEDGDLERRRARELLVFEIRKRVGLQAQVQVAQPVSTRCRWTTQAQPLRMAMAQ